MKKIEDWSRERTGKEVMSAMKEGRINESRGVGWGGDVEGGDDQEAGRSWTGGHPMLDWHVMGERPELQASQSGHVTADPPKPTKPDM